MMPNISTSGPALKGLLAALVFMETLINPGCIYSGLT